MDRLSGEVAADWRNIGYGLLPFNVVKNLVDGEASGCQGRLDSTLQCWLEAGGATMEGLIRAVQSPSVGPNQIHKELMKMLKDQGAACNKFNPIHPIENSFKKQKPCTEV